MTYNIWRIMIFLITLGTVVLISGGLLLYEERRFKRLHPNMYRKRKEITDEYRHAIIMGNEVSSDVECRVGTINSQFRDLKWCKVAIGLSLVFLVTVSLYLNILDLFGGKYVGFDSFDVNRLSYSNNTYECKGYGGCWLNLPEVTKALKGVQLDSDSTYFDVLNVKANYKQLSFVDFLSYTFDDSSHLEKIANYDITYEPNTVSLSYEGKLEKKFHNGKWALFDKVWLTGNDLSGVLKDLDSDTVYTIDLVYNKRTKDFKIINAVKKG